MRVTGAAALAPEWAFVIASVSFRRYTPGSRLTVVAGRAPAGRSASAASTRAGVRHGAALVPAALSLPLGEMK